MFHIHSIPITATRRLLLDDAHTFTTYKFSWRHFSDIRGFRSVSMWKWTT